MKGHLILNSYSRRNLGPLLYTIDEKATHGMAPTPSLTEEKN